MDDWESYYNADYGNEGRNYPTEESTQGSGGSPVNASVDDFDWSGLWGTIKNFVNTPGGSVATAGGLAALMKMFGLNEPNIVGGGGGYQGAVPLYSATRAQLPTPEYKPYAQFDPAQKGAYRPGQGGITYFSPMVYGTTGFEPKTSHDFIRGAPVSAQPATPPEDEVDLVAPPPPSGEPLKPDGTPRAYANGGIAMLAGGGRFLKGRGDGVSDDIPAVIHSAQGGQPAKLADGEFVIPARVVAEIGNGSSEAGARKLYAMLDRIEKLGKKAKRGQPSGADKELNKLA